MRIFWLKFWIKTYAYGIYYHFWLVYKALNGRWDGGWRVPANRVLFYRVKAAICLLLNIEPTKERWSDPEIYEDIIYITGLRGGVGLGADLETVYWGESIIVGPGILKDWWASVYGDSS